MDNKLNYCIHGIFINCKLEVCLSQTCIRKVKEYPNNSNLIMSDITKVNSSKVKKEILKV